MRIYTHFKTRGSIYEILKVLNTPPIPPAPFNIFIVPRKSSKSFYNLPVAILKMFAVAYL